jgi:hypothetical protein
MEEDTSIGIGAALDKTAGARLEALSTPPFSRVICIGSGIS